MPNSFKVTPTDKFDKFADEVWVTDAELEMLKAVEKVRKTIPQEKHEELLELSLTIYAKIWEALAKV